MPSAQGQSQNQLEDGRIPVNAHSGQGSRTVDPVVFRASSAR